MSVNCKMCLAAYVQKSPEALKKIKKFKVLKLNVLKRILIVILMI